MSDNLGIFNEEEFAVMKPKQQTTTPPPPPKDDKKKKPEEKPEDENLDEIPLKTKEEILDGLKKAGIIKDDEIPDDDSNEPKDDKGNEDGGNEPKDDEGKEDGGEKPTDDKGTEDGGEKPKKKGNKGQIEDIEGEKRRDKIKATSIINKKINDYEEVLIKDEYGVFKLPNRVKQTLLDAKKDLEALKEKL